MAKRMIYVRMAEGYSTRQPIEAFNGVLFKDEQCEVLLTDGRKGFISRNMARRVLKVRPDILRKRNLNALMDWLSEKTGKRDRRNWQQILGEN